MTNDELPEGWVEAPFSAVTVDPVQRVPAGDEEITYIDIGSVDRVTKTISQPQTMVGKDAPSRARKVIKTGDVLVSTVRPNLNAVALVDRRFEGQFASTGFDVLRSPVLDPRWVFFSVRTPAFVERMTELVQGALYPAVRSKDVRAFTIPIAPLAEQKRIADKLEAVLGRAEACRARLDRIPDLLKRFRQSVLAAATSGQLTQDWREEYAPSVQWQSLLFGDVVTSSFYGPRFSADDYSDSGVPTIRTTDMNYRGDINVSESPRVRITEAELEHLGLKDGDLVITRTGATIGKCGLYRDSLGPALPSAYLIRFRLNQEAIDPDFALLFLMSPEGQSQLIGGTTAVAQPNVNAKAISAIPLNLPPPEEQVEIVHRVEALFALADRIEARLATAQRLVERLTPATLSKAFRGDLVPQDPNDEPASKLLERLAAKFSMSPKKSRPN